jgi:hypothetical protein
MYACPGATWQGVACDAATGRVTHVEFPTVWQLCSPNPCQLPPTLFSTLSALAVFKLPDANIAANLATLDLSGSYMMEVLDLSGNPGVTGQLNGDWPNWMPYLKNLSLSGATDLVSSQCIVLEASGVFQQ